MLKCSVFADTLCVFMNTQKFSMHCNINIKPSDKEFAQISIIVHALDPVKIVVEAICRRDANFIIAEATIGFLFEEIQSYPTSEYNN